MKTNYLISTKIVDARTTIFFCCSIAMIVWPCLKFKFFNQKKKVFSLFIYIWSSPLSTMVWLMNDDCKNEFFCQIRQISNILCTMCVCVYSNWIGWMIFIALWQQYLLSLDMVATNYILFIVIIMMMIHELVVSISRFFSVIWWCDKLHRRQRQQYKKWWQERLKKINWNFLFSFDIDNDNWYVKKLICFAHKKRVGKNFKLIDVMINWIDNRIVISSIKLTMKYQWQIDDDKAFFLAQKFE